MNEGEKPKGSWWQTIPGVLTATAATITAATGLIVALHQAGMFSAKDQSSVPPSPPTKPSRVESASTTANTPPTASAKELTGRAAPSAPSPSSPAAKAMNLLSVENGGQLLLAPSDAWKVVIDGKEDQYQSVRVGEEAVFAFKDEHAATFDRFGMLIPKTGRNPKEFELFAGSDSPTGAYRSIGTFQPLNLRVMKTDGWQDFSFPPVTAKYLKVKLRSNYEDVIWIEAYEFRLFGKLPAQ